MKLTDGDDFILRTLRNHGTFTPRQLSWAARCEGYNSASLWRKWAAPRLRKLRAMGLVVYTGQHASQSRFHAITLAGREYLIAKDNRWTE